MVSRRRDDGARERNPTALRETCGYCETSPRTTKTPHSQGFRECAEEDSNLHPLIPDQALNPCHPGVRCGLCVHIVQNER